MSAFLDKSKEYEVAATLVRERSQYNACMHSYYYSLILFATHLLVNKDGISIDDLIKSKTVNKNKPTSHNVIREQLKNKIKSALRYDKTEYASFSNNFNKLKALRETADYSNGKLDSHSAINAENYLKDLKRTLKKVYGL